MKASDFKIEFQDVNPLKCFFSITLMDSLLMNGGFIYAIVDDKKYDWDIQWTMFQIINPELEKQLKKKIIAQLRRECNMDAMKQINKLWPAKPEE